jgi:hypothetical protein
MAQFKNTLKNLKIQECKAYLAPKKGAALIIFLTILVLGSTTILLSELNHIHFQIKNQKQTTSVLAQAKEALLGFALTYAETHQGQMQGYLPCQDKDGDGDADTSCSSKGNSVIGRFPWRTLGLPPLRDGSGECLWYAVSGTYKNNPKQILTNTTEGLFIVKDANGSTTPAERAIAIIFAPGRIVDGSRTATNSTPCGDNVQIIDYLDSLEIDENGDSVPDYTIKNFSGQKTDEASGNPGGDELPTATPSVFIKAPLTKEDGKVIFNDILMLITPKDFAPVYERMNYWVAKQVTKCLESYAANNGNKFPWASKLDPYDYTDDSGERFGRIPDAPLNATHSDNNEMSKTWPTDCFDEENEDWKWWQEWKEMVFFAINSAASPPVEATDDTLTLTTPTETKNVNLVVLVAGAEINGQTRSDKTDISNYLEDENADGDENFISQAATNDFNDVACWNSECTQ